ncbi:MAG: hypothetical protein QM500_21755, partial [Methylococcales bacterium]
MTVSAKHNKNKGLTLFSTLIIGFVALIGLQGCSSSSGGGTTPIATQDASGLFKDGTAELNSGATMLSDLRAFVHNGRIIIFSVAGNLLFDGQITDITADDYTATVDVYEAGLKTQSAVAVTGKVTSESSITGTIAGTGNASGTFTLTFDTLYSRGATFARIDTSTTVFAGDIFNSVPDAATINFDFFSSTNYNLLSRSPGPIRCSDAGSFLIPDSSINIYTLDETIVQTDPGCTMSI